MSVARAKSDVKYTLSAMIMRSHFGVAESILMLGTTPENCTLQPLPTAIISTLHFVSDYGSISYKHKVDYAPTAVAGLVPVQKEKAAHTSSILGLVMGTLRSRLST